VIVLDSSAAVDLLVGQSSRDWVVDRLREDPDLHAPHILDVEVVGAIRRLVVLGRLSVERAERALLDLVALDLARYSHVPLLPAMWALRKNVTASDAAFVALAEALDAVLITTDRRLARAPKLPVRLLAP
jgi:predicted nucleic acid-binding protein